MLSAKQLDRLDRAFYLARYAEASREIVMHLLEHERATAGIPLYDTLGCDHVGGPFCQHLDSLLEYWRSRIAELDRSPSEGKG